MTRVAIPDPVGLHAALVPSAYLRHPQFCTLHNACMDLEFRLISFVMAMKTMVLYLGFRRGIPFASRGSQKGVWFIYTHTHEQELPLYVVGPCASRTYIK